MAEDSKIQWTKHSWNPWRGCSKISPGCKFCYADTQANINPKVLGVWGPKGTRVVAAEAQWKLPIKWDKAAREAGERHRVFCASMADVFEDWSGKMVSSSGSIIRACDSCGLTIPGEPPKCHGVVMRLATMDDIRRRLFRLIDATPNLDWLLLTKRPENIVRMLPGVVTRNVSEMSAGALECGAVEEVVHAFRKNVWLGTSVEDQQRANERIPELLKIPAKVRFLSVEPMLGPIRLDISRWGGCYHGGHSGRDHEADHGECACHLDWDICGGESGTQARPFDLSWARSLRDQCKTANVPFFMKQIGSDPISTLSLPVVRPDGERLIDKKGGDQEEWAEDLRVREFPTVRMSS